MTSILLNVLSGGEGENEKVKQQLINNVKREIKQLMEEAVTRRYIYIQSGSVNSLCGAVEACLSHGLKRKALGLFKTSSTTALIQKIRKNCAEAEHVNRCLMKWEGSADDCTNITMKSMMVKSTKYSTPISSDCIIKAKLLAKDDSTLTQSININSAVVSKYLWIRVALYEKRLVRIINHLVDNAKLYYDGNALVADTDYGFLLSSLLVGPCALDFTKTKTIEHYWSDPPADELVQRHRISSGNRTPPICHRPLLNFKRSLHTSSEESNSGSFKTTSPAIVAKDYVESLHQNSHATLLYGKNNVLVLPKDFIEPIPGYLSLHRTIQSLIIKWTPNQLMNICNDKNTTTTADGSIDLNMYWNYAFNTNVDDIVYVHCHQNNGDDNGGTIILVGHDGVQRPPIHFPEGGHMLLFLGCLETGLLPHGQLDPPLWSQRTRGQAHNFWPRRIQERIFSGISTRNTENSFDYVFRVIRTSNREELAVFHSLLVLGSNGSRHKHLSSCSTNGSSDCSSKSLSLEQNLTDQPLIQSSKADSIELVCSSMKRQIISRAFYGWLAYCRHLSTVRTHLSGLVNYQIIPELEPNENGLTEITWLEMHDNGKLLNDMHIYRLVYFGGVPHKLRAKVWPYLLGHYSFGSTIEERAQLTINTKHCYETTMSEWLAVEAIVQQRDIEKNVKSSGNVIYTESVQNLQSDVIMENENEEQIKSEIFEDDHQELSDVSDIEVTHKNEIITGNAIMNDKAAGNFIMEKNTSGDEEFQLQKGNLNLNLLNVESQNADISPSTSSYETVVNEFNDVSEIFRNANSPDIETKISLKEEYVEDYDTPEEINRMDYHEADNNSHNLEDVKQQTKHSVAITDADDSANHKECLQESSENTLAKIGCISIPNEDRNEHKLTSLDIEHTDNSICASPASSNGGVYSCEFLENFALNLHRIDKDVQRCDRNYSYFAKDNLNKLRNIITTYVWKHLDIGYMQGMCDLVAPLLVVFDDEALTYSCFCKFMERMIDNFPNGGAMDMHFANMRSLIQILDAEMYELMDSNGDYTHFYFCYRWFLLDFKRELLYDDIFATWEVIWAAKHVASTHFVLFFALALLETYRDIILSNSMDFTDIIKFFNEMAERHNVQAILKLARNLVLQLQTIIENK